MTKPISFLSFDVEALPGRSKEDPLDHLVWGTTTSEGHGIIKIMDILDSYGVKGNFMVDLSICKLYGDDQVTKIFRYIDQRGHDIHVHLHPEWLLRSEEVKFLTKETGVNFLEAKLVPAIGFDRLPKIYSDRYLQYAFFKFNSLIGRPPIGFRSGAFLFNQNTIDSAFDAGFKFLSNFNAIRHKSNVISSSDNSPFMWKNGMIEIPVDFSPEPLSFNFDHYLGWFARAEKKCGIKTFNLVMHSWSLLKRNAEGFMVEYSPEYESRLRRIVEHLLENTIILTYSELVNQKNLDLEIANVNHLDGNMIDIINKTFFCNICDHIEKEKSDSDVCKVCGSRTRHRQLKDAFRSSKISLVGKKVLANFANSNEVLYLLKGSDLTNFDVRPIAGLDLQMDIQNMDAISDKSFDVFYAAHVLNHVKNDKQALREIYRILKDDGYAILTVPYAENGETIARENVLEHYGQDAFDKYGVGSYRRYGLSDIESEFECFFKVEKIFGYDALYEEGANIFKLYKRAVI